MPDMTHDNVSLMVNLAPAQLLAQLPKRLQNFAHMRFHHSGPQHSRVEVAKMLYSDGRLTAKVKRVESRLARQLWRCYKGWHQLRHIELQNDSSTHTLTGCTGCHRLLRVPVRTLTLPSTVYAVCQPCRAKGYHPMKLFPEAPDAAHS